MCDGPEEFRDQIRPARDERLEEPTIGVAVRAEAAGCLLEGLAHEQSGAVVERMRERSRRLDQVELELERAKEG
jgi:hypothetical protein